jgi:hypothetical protein
LSGEARAGYFDTKLFRHEDEEVVPAVGLGEVVMFGEFAADIGIVNLEANLAQ